MKDTQVDKNGKNENIKEWIISFAVAIVFVSILRSFFIGFAIVDGPSMLNTIEDGDRIFYAKMMKPETGDIVVVETIEGIKIIKRVIGLEGDKVEIKSGVLYVNGKEIEEDYIKEPMYDTDMESIVVPKNEIFVMGDNRNISADSRLYGTFDLDKDYKGKVIFELFNDIKIY